MKVTSLLPTINTKGITPQDSKMHAKFINGITHTPHRQHITNKATSHECAICGCPDAKEEHIIFDCPHKLLTKLRSGYDKTLTDAITGKSNLYSQPHPKAAHPIENIPMNKLYPYATSMREKDRDLNLEGLPEGRWYRQSTTSLGYITVQHPQNRKYAKEQNVPRRKMIRIPYTTFWKLIAWHEITNQDLILEKHEYDERAKDIWDVVTNTKKESGDAKLCWAADITLLDILIDECGCTSELFSNIMNTYHRFTERRSLCTHKSFTKHAKLYYDGLLDDAFKGGVYGNPPFDGTITRNNTIKRTLDKAETTSSNEEPFRAIFFLPLTPNKLKERLEHPNVKLLMKFPNNTVPFTPDTHWYGLNKGKPGCYDEENTNLVLLKYENPAAETNIQIINYPTLYTKLANWYLNILPPHKRQIGIRKYIGVDIEYFDLITSN